MKKLLGKRVLEKKIFAVFLALSLMVGTLAAGGGFAEKEVKAASEDTGVHLSETQVTVYLDEEKEKIINLLGIEYDEEGVGVEVSWTTDNSKIASVDYPEEYTEAYIEPVGLGTTVITAKCQGKEYTCKVTVERYSPKTKKQWNRLLTACKKKKYYTVTNMVTERNSYFHNLFYDSECNNLFYNKGKKDYLIYYTDKKKTKGIAIYEQKWNERLQVYYGEMKNGFPGGKGTIFGETIADPIMLSGTVKDGYLTGKVKMTTDDYDNLWVYEGNMKKGLWNGTISITKKEGKDYVWHFKAKCKNGKWQKHKKKPGKYWKYVLKCLGYKTTQFQKFLSGSIPCSEKDLKRYRKGSQGTYCVYEVSYELGDYAKGYR